MTTSSTVSRYWRSPVTIFTIDRNPSQQDVSLDRLFMDVAVYKHARDGAAHVETLPIFACTALAYRGVAHINFPSIFKTRKAVNAQSAMCGPYLGPRDAPCPTAAQGISIVLSKFLTAARRSRFYAGGASQCHRRVGRDRGKLAAPIIKLCSAKQRCRTIALIRRRYRPAAPSRRRMRSKVATRC